MISISILIVFVILALMAGLWAGWELRGQYISETSVTNIANDSSRVTVVVPADYKPLEPLVGSDGKPALVGPRAFLWWTIFNYTLDMKGTPSTGYDVDSAIDAANAAVEQVYGDTHDS